jgi:hypothetical protein
MAALWEEFHAATHVLVGVGPVKQRLIDAYRHHLASLREHDIPEIVRDRFVALKAAMHEAPATGGLSAAEASVRKMSERNAADHAAGILEMFVVLSAEAESAPRLRIVSSDNVADDRRIDDLFDVPAFLSRA